VLTLCTTEPLDIYINNVYFPGIQQKKCTAYTYLIVRPVVDAVVDAVMLEM
jgi:hypothetical protein